jgi:hypothetical protein
MAQEKERRLVVWKKYPTLLIALGIGAGRQVGKVFPKTPGVNS